MRWRPTADAAATAAKCASVNTSTDRNGVKLRLFSYLLSSAVTVVPGTLLFPSSMSSIVSINYTVHARSGAYED